MLLLLFKFTAGILGHSTAMIADAVHSLSDFVTDIIVIIFVRISGKPQDKCHDYGHGKYETLATAVIGVILMAVGIGVLWSGVSFIWAYAHGVPLEEPGILALIAALASIVIKELLYHYTVFIGRKVDSQAVVANAWHHRSDALSSIGTAIGIGGAILLGTRWRVLDPIAAVVVSFFIIKVSYQLIVPCIGELTEQSLSDDIEKQIEDALLSVIGVADPHNMRTRKIGNRASVNVHVRMDGNISLRQAHQATKEMEQKVRRILGPETFVNIHVEPVK